MKEQINYDYIINEIQKQVEDYLVKCNLQSLVIGVSGGFDSGIGCALLAPICKKLNIPLIGRYVHIESNKQEEKDRAISVGNAFCSDFKCKDLTNEYLFFLHKAEEPSLFGGFNYNVTDVSDKIRRGNVKVRLRVNYLYNLAQKTKGIVVGCNNLTEYLLGFFTIGDGGDINPFINIYKTDLYELAKVYKERLETDEEKQALQSVIDAVPTDGLGITNSDFDQFGVNSYDAVDEILKTYSIKKYYGKIDNELQPLYDKYNKESVWKVINRHLNSEFKRNHPYKIVIK